MGRQSRAELHPPARPAPGPRNCWCLRTTSGRGCSPTGSGRASGLVSPGQAGALGAGPGGSSLCTCERGLLRAGVLALCS